MNGNLVSFEEVLESIIKNNKDLEKVRIPIGSKHCLEFSDKILNQANGFAIGWYVAIDGLEVFNMFDGLNSKNIALLKKDL